MSLPKPPHYSEPIPNEPFSSPEVTSIRGPYWNMPIGSGLQADSYGSIQISGDPPSDPAITVYGPNGEVGVGSGLIVSQEGYLEVD